jgi:hypothetical protein
MRKLLAVRSRLFGGHANDFDAELDRAQRNEDRPDEGSVLRVTGNFC